MPSIASGLRDTASWFEPERCAACPRNCQSPTDLHFSRRLVCHLLAVEFKYQQAFSRTEDCAFSSPNERKSFNRQPEDNIWADVCAAAAGGMRSKSYMLYWVSCSFGMAWGVMVWYLFIYLFVFIDTASFEPPRPLEEVWSTRQYWVLIYTEVKFSRAKVSECERHLKKLKLHPSSILISYLLTSSAAGYRNDLLFFLHESPQCESEVLLLQKN